AFLRRAPDLRFSGADRRARHRSGGDGYPVLAGPACGGPVAAALSGLDPLRDRADLADIPAEPAGRWARGVGRGAADRAVSRLDKPLHASHQRAMQSENPLIADFVKLMNSA